MALGDSIRAHFGAIAENWPSKCDHNALILLRTYEHSSSDSQVAERAARRQS